MTDFTYFQSRDGKEWEAPVVTPTQAQLDAAEFVTFTDDHTVWQDAESHELFATFGGLFNQSEAS